MIRFPRQSRFRLHKENGIFKHGRLWMNIEQPDHSLIILLNQGPRQKVKNQNIFHLMEKNSYSVNLLLESKLIYSFDKDLMLLNLDFFEHVISKHWTISWEMMRTYSNYTFIIPGDKC